MNHSFLKSLMFLLLFSVSLEAEESIYQNLLDAFDIHQDYYDADYEGSNIWLNDPKLSFINDQIFEGCSDDFYQQVLQLPTNDEYTIIFKDILKVACLWYRDPDQSLDLFKEVQERINKDSEFYASYDLENDPNYRFIYFYNLVISAYPYYIFGLDEEYLQWFDNTIPLYESLIQELRFKPFDFIAAQYFISGVMTENFGSSVGIRRVRENIESTIFSMLSNDQEVNKNLANLLLENRIDLIRDLAYLDEYELLAGELSDFNKIYFQNFESGLIFFSEFENYYRTNLSSKGNLRPEVIEDLTFRLDPIFIYELDPFVDVFIEIFQRDIFFPQRDEALEGYLEITNHFAHESMDALLGLTSFINEIIYDHELVGFSSIRAKNICEKAIGIEQRELNFSEGLVYGEAPTEFDIEYAKLQIEEIKLGCNFDAKGKRNYLAYVEDFISRNIYLFDENGYQLSSDDIINSVFRDIFSRLTTLRIDLFFKDDDLGLDEVIVNLMNKLLGNEERIFLISSIDNLEFANTYFLQAAVILLSESGRDLPDLTIQFSDQLFKEEYLDTLQDQGLKDFVEGYTGVVSSSFFMQFMDLQSPNPINTDDPEWEIYRDRHTQILDNLNTYLVERFGYLSGGGLDWLMPKEIQQTFKSIQITYLFLLSHETIQALNEFYVDPNLDDYSRSQAFLLEDLYLEDLNDNLILSTENSIGLNLYRRSIQNKYSQISHPVFQYIDYIDQLNQIKNAKIISKNDPTIRNTDELNESMLLQALEELRKSNLEDDDFQDFLKEDYLGNFSGEYINEALSNDEVFLSFFDDPYLPTMIVHNSDRTFTVPLVGLLTNALNITTFIDNLLQFRQIDGFKPNDFDLELASTYHDVTFGFLEQYNFFRDQDADAVNKIYIHTTGDFDDLPFSALYDPRSEKFLIEKYQITYIPDQLSFLMLTEGERLSAGSNFIGIGDPSLSGTSLKTEFDNLFDRRGEVYYQAINKLASLPSTGEELKEISKLFYSSSIYLRDQAVERSIGDYLNKDVDIISFATHAVENFSEETYEVGLVLSPPERNSFEDGILTRGEISKLNLIDKPTIVLSACNTSRGLFSGASKYSGLTSGFLEAGAGGLIVSSWDLETNSARDLSVLAHKIAIKEEISIGSGYRQAMIEFIRNPKYKKYSHPYFWAGFQVIGK